MGGQADRNRFQIRGDQRRQARILAQRQDQRQGPRPELRGNLAGAGVEKGKAFGHRQIADMHDQGVETRAALGLKNPGDGQIIGRIAAKPVNRLGRKGHQPAATQNLGCAGNALGGCGQALGAKAHLTQRCC